ncbi:MAG: hypothetical protein R3B81_19680 [bacterium]
MKRIPLKLRKDVVRELTTKELHAPAGGWDDTTWMMPLTTEKITILNTVANCPPTVCHLSCYSCPY